MRRSTGGKSFLRGRREPFHTLVIRNLFEETPNRFAGPRVKKIASDFCKRDQDELPFSDPRVGNLKLFGLSRHIVKEENVQIDRPRPPAKRFPPTQSRFNSLEDPQKGQRPELCFDLDYAVYEPVLRGKTDGLRLEKGGPCQKSMMVSS
jgi:hypothetical protein